MNTTTFSENLPPVAAGLIGLAIWEFIVWGLDVSPFFVPAPSAVVSALIEHHAALLASTWVSVRLTAVAFVCALFLGIGIAIAFSQSRTLERALYPYAVTLQVTPIVAIAPLIVIWVGVDNAEGAVLILAIVVAFFPILANTTIGLRSADQQLQELFQLYGATRWQRLCLLQLPSALPFLLTGAKIAGGLALIGTIVAEFAAGSGTSTGLGWTIIEAGNRLQTAKVFAALTLLSFIGVGIFTALSLLERRLLRNWHESTRN